MSLLFVKMFVCYKCLGSKGENSTKAACIHFYLLSWPPRQISHKCPCYSVLITNAAIPSNTSIVAHERITKDRTQFLGSLKKCDTCLEVFVVEGVL